MNLERLNQDIHKLYEQKMTREKVFGHIDSLREEIEKEEEQNVKLVKKLEKSEEKLEDLQELSMRSIFAKIAGNKEEKISEEREAYMEAAMNYTNGVKKVEALKFEKNSFIAEGKKTGRCAEKTGCCAGEEKGNLDFNQSEDREKNN